MSDEPTRVLLVDDHALIRTGLAGVFELEDDMTIAGVAGSVAEALSPTTSSSRTSSSQTSSSRTAPASTSSGRSARQSQTTGLIVLTMHSGDDQIFAAMEAGASGFVGKDAPSSEVVKAARHAAIAPRSFVCAG